MPHETQVPFTGDAKKALETGREVFIHHGFQVSSIENSSFEATRAGGTRNTNQEGIIGISKARVAVAGGAISVRAEFGNLWRLIKLLILGFWAMEIGFSIFAGLQQGLKHGLMVLLALPLTAILLVVIGGGARKRGEEAIDTLVANMAALGGKTD